MLDDELAEIIGRLRALGADHAGVEAKRAETKLPKRVRETLSAFANTSGGVLILGLDEASGFRATGVADPAKLAADLGALCSENMEPPLRPLIQTHRFEGATLVVAGAGVGPGRSRVWMPWRRFAARRCSSAATCPWAGCSRSVTIHRSSSRN